MSRLPPTNERGYQPIPPQQGSSGLFDRRTDRSPRPSQGYPQSSGPPSYNDRQSTSSSNPGLLSRLTGGSRDAPKVQGGVFRVLKAPRPEAAFLNLIYVSPDDFSRNIGYVIMDDMYVFSVQQDPEIPRGCVGTSLYQREWGRWGLNQEVTVAPYDHFSHGGPVYLGTMDVEVSFVKPNYRTNQEFDSDELAKFFVKSYQGQIFAPGQMVAIDYRSFQLKILVKSVQCVDLTVAEKGGSAKQKPDSSSHTRGILTPETSMAFFKATDSQIKIKASAHRPPPNAIIQPDFKFEDMGIGGLDSEFATIFRRAFASRIMPPGLIEKLGIQHVRGILLYGPPGTGKTLMARQIGKMLRAKEPKIVNGPEILNKFVGQSEENIRKLFADAEKEYKDKGDQSDLHIIIFDELDAITKQRGTTGGGTGVGDTVVNQLLSKMDGVDQLNNILIIGMTNRRDMIDEALLRPGRLEVQLEISLPDEKGRLQILKIHTRNIRSNGLMDTDVNLDELAELTKNFSGAEIAGLIKSATSFAFNRHVKVGSMAQYKDDLSKMKINRDDFMMAFTEVQPAYGVHKEDLASCIEAGIIMYSGMEHLMRQAQRYVEQARTTEHMRVITVLMHGPSESGKTALAASIGINADYPYVRLVSPRSLAGMSELGKVQYIKDAFDDAYKSPLSLVIVDDIERIIEWNAFGGRFSNNLYQLLAILFRKPPPKNRRLLIIGTTSERHVLRQMGIRNCVDFEIGVPNVSTLMELGQILNDLKPFDDQTCRSIIRDIEEKTGSNSLNVGIKTIVTNLYASQKDEDPAGTFADAMIEAISYNNPAEL